MAPKEAVVVKIDSFGNAGNKDKEPEKFPISNKENPAEKSHNLPERSAETMRRRGKESSDQEKRCPSSVSGLAEVLRCSSSSSFRVSSWSSPICKKSRLMDPPEEESCHGFESAVKDEDDDLAHTEDMPEEYKQLKWSAFTVLQWVAFISIIAGLICSLCIPSVKKKTIWDLPLWKWELTVLALICGRLVSTWAVRMVVIIFERNFLLRKRVLYFVYGLRRSVQNCLWLALVLLAWHFIINDRVQKKTRSRILPHVTKILICFLLGSLIWLLKTLFLKILASFFHVNNYFERLKEALFSQYVIQTLSGSPLFEIPNTEVEEAPAEVKDDQNCGANASDGRTETPRSGRVVCSGKLLNCRSSKALAPESNRQDEEIPIDKLNKLNRKNISAWNMRRMINIVRNGALLTLDEKIVQSDTKEAASSLQIKSERQAREAAEKIFQKVAKRSSENINLVDVMRFMNKEEALLTMSLFGATTETQGINLPTFREWMVNAFQQRKLLVLSLNDANTAVEDLHKLLNIFVGTTILVTLLIILGTPILHFLIFMASQLLLLVFIFGNTCKTLFEAIIFLFVMHPFDVGDRCEVDGVEMVVEEMKILTTVFLRYDYQKVIYPNSVLATKAIGNFYRSPDMGDGVDFFIPISTPPEKIALLKQRITRYIEGMSEHWQAAPCVIMKDVEDLNKVKMSVWVTHRMNQQDMAERWSRRAVLIEEIVKIFRELDMEDSTLPVEVKA